MKKMLTALIALVALAAALDADAWFGRNRCRKSCSRIESCERPCVTKKVCPKYRVIEHTEEAEGCPPVCCRYVKVKEPAVCIKNTTCKWVCPPSCSEDGYLSAEEYDLVEKSGEVKRVMTTDVEV